MTKKYTVEKKTRWEIDGKYEVDFEPIEEKIKIKKYKSGHTVSYMTYDLDPVNPFLSDDGIGKIIYHPTSRYVCNTNDYHDSLTSKYMVPLLFTEHISAKIEVHPDFPSTVANKEYLAIWIPDTILIELIEQKKEEGEEESHILETYAKEAGELYNQYVNGEVYGFINVRFDNNNREIQNDSVWGIIPDDVFPYFD